jgi:acetyl-CoA synthetase
VRPSHRLLLSNDRQASARRRIARGHAQYRPATARVRAARDFLLNHREDYGTAYRDYRSPALEEFNWALDWFDAIAADGADRPALWIVEPGGGETRRTFAELSACSNQVELWETILATMKLGAVIIPATPMLEPADLVDRVERGEARHVVVPAAHAIKFDDVPGTYTKITVGEPVDVSSRPRITGSRPSSSRVC